jgi:endonuclease/exonuclease/phosphatase family metal-dependent hydrolase
VGCALVLALTAWSRFAGTAEAPAREASRAVAGQPVVPRAATPSFTLLQMNLCLSGLANCYAAAAYPAGLWEAVARIRETRPDAVTLNETCRRDVERIARRTGYHLRFSRVMYGGEELPCVDPGGRGLFGDAVLTRSPVRAFEQGAFAAQGGLEERRWSCVTTRREQDVCTAHLGTRRNASATAANDAQCAELRAVLARHAAARAVAFGGDVNRSGSCAPRGLWTRTDASAAQSPGVQHVYGSADAFRSPAATVLPDPRSDHDALLVRARRVLR